MVMVAINDDDHVGRPQAGHVCFTHTRWWRRDSHWLRGRTVMVVTMTVLMLACRQVMVGDLHPLKGSCNNLLHWTVSPRLQRNCGFGPTAL